jgi:cellulose synthase/poly-beta-1,6-N-acetylglucosamine synthase-like glycosyltransferase/peptidoglycan/xylan/chitin deacetylase (PgdA/CDA1 family)/spore germination protein YaaH
MAKPIFYDPTGQRRKWSSRGLILIACILFGAVAVVAFSVISVAVPRNLPIVYERNQPRPLRAQLNAIGHNVGAFGRAVTGWLPRPRNGADKVNQLIVGFYVPWDPDSRASLLRHVNDLDWLVPVAATVGGGQHVIAMQPDTRVDAIITTSSRHPSLFPMLQNRTAGKWDTTGIASLLASKTARAKLIGDMVKLVEQQKGRGIVYDFEEVPASAQNNYVTLIAETRAQFAPRGWKVMLTVPVGDTDWPLAALSKAADRVFIMDYDEHDDSSDAGPIASQSWFINQMNAALAKIPANKAILAIGSYGLDWHDKTADPMTIEEAWLAANDSETKPVFDKVSGNSTFSYDENGSVHSIWMLDAASAWNQLRAADRMGVAGIALWRLGSEDPSIWEVFRKFQTNELPNMATVHPQGAVDIEGNGEILHIQQKPVDGKRRVTFDSDQVIRDQVFDILPTPFVVRRTGYQPGMVALTFDDGPDVYATPKILDILEAKHVPATFFVIGENALSHPDIINRIISSPTGSEIGNHSYFHPNMALLGDERIKFELNMTQRIVQAYSGHSMRLFRAPYFGDAEPTTNDELVPATDAQGNGYTNIGLHVDPGDWKKPGVQPIIDETIAQVLEGNNPNTPDMVKKDPNYRTTNIVLLHDGGGDRTQTIQALPGLIDALRARGYKFVPVSALAGLTPAEVMPVVSGQDLMVLRFDVGIFRFAAFMLWALQALFYTAISLGIARAVILAVLALYSRFDRSKPVAPPIDPTRFVSVLIPAFNEERVIEGSVWRVLASEQVQLEIIVIDDGSSDGTAEIVRTAFANEPRVQLLSLPNGGKAHALNQGIKLAKGDVIIALDADTQFEPLTIARMARWFADADIGAVAGNAKVGNKINLVTRWQAIEYVTAQNLERRALDQLGAITVVPGAVGAWRRSALDSVGGYPVDTLAEDQDLTIAVQRKGWLVAYDIDAVAWTESPETFKALSKQRFRWAFGTLQCLWKHKAIIRSGKPLGLALVGLPQAWIFQIAFACISPIIDLALIVSLVTTVIRVYEHGWAQTQSDVLTMGLFWLAFTSIDAISGYIAYALEPRRQPYPVLLLIAQRFIYRQLMYSVVIRAVSAALTGPRVGWGKLERSGRSEVGSAT